MSPRFANDSRTARARFAPDFASLMRYGVVGIVLNALFYGFALVLLYLHFAAWQATLMLYPVAVVLSFIANRLWSFAGRKRTRTEFQKYLLVYAVTSPIAVSLTWAQERAGVPSWLASLTTL